MPIPVGPGNRDIWTKIALDKLLDYSKQVNSDESKWSSDQIVTALMDDVDVLYPSWSTDWIEKELKHLENGKPLLPSPRSEPTLFCTLPSPVPAQASTGSSKAMAAFCPRPAEVKLLRMAEVC